jgi:type I restriction enzyme M protein
MSSSTLAVTPTIGNSSSTSLSLNKPKLDNLANEVWKSAERLRGKFKAYGYQNVILPIIVIRRLECVLIQWREAKTAEIRTKRPNMPDKELTKLVKELELNPKQSPFSNKTDWTLRKVYEEDHTLLEDNFRAYINGFSENVQDIIEHFNYRATIGLMVKNNRLAPILNQYKELALGPDQLSNLEMGYIYEELLRRFSEQSGEEAGEHFTPREVIRLMVELLEIPIPEKHLSIYDPACGTGGMLSVAKEHLLDRAATEAEKVNVEKYVTVHGQELSPTNYAICQADMLIKNDRQAKVFPGNSLIPHDERSREPGDRLPETNYCFNFMLSNPPFGVTWGGKDGYETEARKLKKTRYRAECRAPTMARCSFCKRCWPRCNCRRKVAAVSPLSLTAHRFRTGIAAPARAKSAAGFWSTTGSMPSSCCPTSFSTTPASSPTSGCCGMKSQKVTVGA